MAVFEKSQTEKPFGDIPFIDLATQQRRIRKAVDERLARVLDHGIFVMGPEVLELEQKLSHFCDAPYTLSCSNGTDALALALMAKEVRKGDAVFVPSFTFAATAEVVAWMDATIVFVDVRPDTFNMDPESLMRGIGKAKEKGLKPVCVIPVDLFGLPADYDAIETCARDNGMWVMADAAQSFGATYKGRKVGSIGDVATTSFFPAKPLGCYGDGGAVFTGDSKLIERMRSLRVHGQGADKYDNVYVGMNGRLDTLQAAILLEKLIIFPEELEQRQRVADQYSEILAPFVQTPLIPDDCTSSWAQYTVCLPPQICRDSIIRNLKADGIPSVVYYVKPLHKQQAYQGHLLAEKNDSLPVCEDLSRRVLSLPMSAYVSQEMAVWIAQRLVFHIQQLS